MDQSDELIVLAEDISSIGVKNLDALHLAVAITSKCDYFITVDRRILKYRTNRIKVINPVDVMEEWNNG